jgi:branched-chain amino acid transport system permease protein
MDSGASSGASCCPICSACFLRPSAADGIGGAAGSIAIYLLMAAVLFHRPRRLFSVHG